MAVAVAEPDVQEVEVGAGLHPFLASLMSRIDLEPTFATEQGLLYSFKGPGLPLDPERQSTVKDNQCEISIKPESVTFKEITHTKGVNRVSGKIYQNWKVETALTFSFKASKHGHRVLRVYRYVARTRKYGGSFTNCTADATSKFNLPASSNLREIDLFTREAIGRDPESRNPFDIQWGYRGVSHDLLLWVVVQLLKELDPAHPALAAEDFMNVAAYPLFRLFPKSDLDPAKMKFYLPKKFSLHEEPDVKKFITHAFGAEGIRKDMVKAVVDSTSINAIFLAARLKGLFPLDWLRDVVKDPLGYAIYSPQGSYRERESFPLAEFLGTLSLPQRKRLLLERVSEKEVRRGGFYGSRHALGIEDSIRMFFQLNPAQREEYGHRIDYSSWKRLHDTLTEVGREIRLKVEAEALGQSFELEGSYMNRLDGTSYELDGETYVLQAPQNGYDLEAWGNEMHNCIGSYRDSVAGLRTNVLAVRCNGTLFANPEIGLDGAIRQYMHKYNQPASAPHAAALEGLIRKVQAEEKALTAAAA